LADWELRHLKKDIQHAKEASERRQQKSAEAKSAKREAESQAAPKRQATRPAAPVRETAQEKPRSGSWPLDPRRLKRQG